jgi:hypothetical protein
VAFTAKRKSGKAIFIFSGNFSTPEQKYLFSVSFLLNVHKYFIKTAMGAWKKILQEGDYSGASVKKAEH